MSLRDLNSGFMCFRREVLHALDMDAFRWSGFGYNVEVKRRFHQMGFQIMGVPIVFKDRRVGCSNLSARIFAEGMVMVGRLRLAKGTRKPPVSVE